jgi:hypothetical protein
MPCVVLQSGDAALHETVYIHRLDGDLGAPLTVKVER